MIKLVQMAIDYIIERDCEVRKKLTTEGLLSLIKEQGRATSIMELLKNQGMCNEQVMHTKFTFQLNTPEGSKEVVGTVADIKEKTKPLEDLKEHCRRCMIPDMLRAAADKDRCREAEPFSCIRSINYPVSSIAEEWLARLAGESVTASGARLELINLIMNNDIPVGRIKVMRADPDGQFFRRKTPLKIPVKKSLFGSKTITTDQILTVIFREQVMDFHLIEPVLLFSGGFFTDDHKPEEGESQVSVCIKAGDVQMWKVLNLKDSKDDDQSIYQIKSFLRALYVALVCGHEVIVIP